MRFRQFLVGLLAIVALASFGCGDEDTSVTGIEVAGTWNSNFGGSETITDDAWNGAAIIEFDNTTNFVVTQTPADSEFNPSKFNKLVWTEPANNAFYYCFVDFGRDTAEQARTSTQTADATEPASSGCGGFSWTELSR